MDTTTGLLSAPMTFRIASTDYDVPFEGVAYAGGGALGGWKINRKGIKREIGTAVAELELDVLLDGTDLLPPADGNSLTPRFSLGEAIAVGLLDGADVLLRRLVIPGDPTYPIGPASIANRGDLGPGDTSLGATIEFRGAITEAQISRSKATIKVKSGTERFQVQFPVNVYQPQCRWTLYSKPCGVSRTGNFGGYGFQALGTITGASLLDTFGVTVASSPALGPDDFFALGTIQFTSGVLCGLALPIAHWDHASQIVYASLRAPRVPAIGDGVCLQAGCDKLGLNRDESTGSITDGTCATKFNNLHGQAGKPGTGFSGEPHMPDPTTAY